MVQSVAFRDLLEKDWPCPVFIENDANAAVLGEVYYGAARAPPCHLCDDQHRDWRRPLFRRQALPRAQRFCRRNRRHQAFGQGRRCKCGGMDCLEAWAAGSAISRRAAALWDDETKKPARSLPPGYLTRPKPETAGRGNAGRRSRGSARHRPGQPGNPAEPFLPGCGGRSGREQGLFFGSNPGTG